MADQPQNHIKAGEDSFRRWQQKTLANPEVRAIYQEEAAKKELWLQLVEARQQAKLTQAEMARRIGISQAQVARIEKSGYDAYTLNTLRRYVTALGDQVELEVRIKARSPQTFPTVVYAT
jgi:DNA-binding XRE family transcriptional regulator